MVVDDTLTCLAHADPGDVDTPSVFAGTAAGEVYEAAFDAWAAAKASIHAAWMWNADPANLTRPVPRVMREAAEIVRTHGAQLGERQDQLVERLEAPYAPRIQRAVRDVIQQDETSPSDRAAQLQDLADTLGLVAHTAPEPLPPITDDDIHLVTWMAVLPGPSIPPA